MDTEDEQLRKRMVETLTRDAAHYSVDLSDPRARHSFLVGLAVSLGLIGSAHETEHIDDASHRFLEDLFGAAVLSFGPDDEAVLAKVIPLRRGASNTRRV